MRHFGAFDCTDGVAALTMSLLIFGNSAYAHHSTAEYDASMVVESRGEVVSVLWRNPHVRLRISTESLDGNPEVWELEGVDLTRLDRAGVPRDLIAVGDSVRFAGNPSTRKPRRMYMTNVLLTDGREILLRGGAQGRWAPDRLIDTYAATTPQAAPVVATTSRDFFDKVLVPTRGPAPAWLADPPLTERARDGRARYDAVTDDPVLGCVSPGMPRVMTRSGPYAVRFIRRGDDIVLQNEWFEIDRLIHMDGAPRANEPYTPLGFSAGRWDGDVLVVTTTHIDWPYFQLYGLEGVPQSRQMRFVERFTPTDDGATVTYDISATDPATFTETVTYERYVTFRWDPTVEFLPYDCIEEEHQGL